MQKRILCLALILVTVLLSSCSEVVVVAPELKEPVGVQSDMATAYIGEIYNISYHDASVVPYIEELYFEVDGTVSKVNIYPGKKVEEGEVLIELDQEAEIENLERLRRQLAYTEQDYAYTDALAELDIDKLRVELKHMMSSGADQTQIELKELEIKQKEANLRQTKALREPDLKKSRETIAELEADLEQNSLKAPFSGTIIYGDVLQEGSYIRAFDNVVYLADDTRLQLMSGFVSDNQFTAASRMYAQIGSEEYEIANVPIDMHEYVSVTLAGGTINTYYDIIGPADKLDEVEAGQYAAVYLLNRYIEDALLVPSGAIMKDVTGNYVYVDNNGQRERRMVQIGMITDGLTQITEGLEEGEVVYVKD